MAKKRPGIIVYFDLYQALKQLSDEQLGRLFRAMMGYGADGIIPNFCSDPLLKFAWEITRSRIDSDGESYQTKMASNLYGTYCRESKKKGIEPVTYSFWSELSPEAQRKIYENLSNDIGR